MEITLQMRTILSGETFKENETVINMKDLNAQYERAKKLSGISNEGIGDRINMTILATIAKFYGVVTDKVSFFRILSLNC
jgi:hypothetical protein